MNTQVEDASISSLVPRSSREAHYHRVALLAREIARHFPLQREERELESIAWLHECPKGVFGDVFSELATSSPVVRGLLQSEGKDPGALMGEIVTIANSLDEMIEWLPFEHQTVSQMLEELKVMNELRLWRPEVEAALHKVVRGQWEAVLSAATRLPVSAVSSVRNLGAIPEDQVSVDLLYRTAAHDPVLTGDLIRVVNSWACPSLRKRVSSLREAICHLGTQSARSVLMASASRKIYPTRAQLELWKHSIEVGAHAHLLGTLAGCDPEAAFLAGIMHDVGSVAVEMLDADTLAKRARLLEPGVPVVWVDLITCRHDHAEIGGALLWRWNFPRSVVDAVSLHHSPERSPSKLASVLYLAEVRSENEEDEVSQVKLEYALRLTGLTREQFREAKPSELFMSLLAA